MISLSDARIWVCGGRGMVGSAVLRALAARGIAALPEPGPRRDLRDQAAVRAFMAEARPDVVVVAAAKVGGIHANATYPADFLYDNLMIAANVIHAAAEQRVAKLLFLGSSCIYPRLAPQPMTEDCLLTGPLEPTNEWYAVAKIAGIKLCQAYRRQHGLDFISCQPTNLYGPGDNFDLAGSHVLPALLRRMHEARLAGAAQVTVWGTGAPRREFLHVDDLAEACLFLLERYSAEAPVNVGVGEDLSIAALARLAAETTGFRGEIAFDPTKPDGAPRKLLDVSTLRGLGWAPRIELAEGMRAVYAWYLAQEGAVRGVSHRAEGTR